MIFPYKTNYFRYKHYFLQLRNLSQKPVAKASLNLILSLLTVSFFSLFAIKPTIITIAKLIKDINNNKQINELMNKKIESLTQAQKNYQVLEKDLTFINNALPATIEFNRLASEINYLVYQNHLVLASANFGEFELLTKADDLQSVSLKIQVAGSFSDIKQFLNNLEHLDRFISFQNVAFNTKSAIKETELQIDITGLTYYLPSTEAKNDNK